MLRLCILLLPAFPPLGIFAPGTVPEQFAKSCLGI